MRLPCVRDRRARRFQNLHHCRRRCFCHPGPDGGIKAYYNICRHRGHPIVEGEGKGKRVLVCPYHAWTYEINGRLRRAPGSVESDGLTCDQINLRTIRVEEFCGFVFVNLDEDAAPMTPALEEYRDNLLSFHPDPT